MWQTLRIGPALLILALAVAVGGCRVRMPGEAQDPGAGPREAKAEQRALMRLWPEKEGFTWQYDGFAEYGHRMTLTDIIEDPDTGYVTYRIIGEVYDASGGESTKDFRLAIDYLFRGDSVTERVRLGEVLPHRITPLEILRYPLNKGANWVQVVEGRTVTAEVVDTGIGQDDRIRFYVVRYTAPWPGLTNDLYTETRTFKEGLGVTNFENNPIPDVEFNYFLYRAGLSDADRPGLRDDR